MFYIFLNRAGLHHFLLNITESKKILLGTIYNHNIQRRDDVLFGLVSSFNGIYTSKSYLIRK